ncbi:carbon-nitrogen hydrolase family protein [Verminephrobacter aporrectodeae subsp. tuberculatae]|uniref:carbon-nitrogen hydrolase family protein n=1 Tax=Verminephrobacter aporrectodeae TaxID=1110389 RepID=UPI002243D0D7|nr:carbon-nitrogen hydrolase family protein [Verminephrobacter aporrectodeae]MCW8198723.1 carbon-nitrogen hydrolase family protein [Verminephrobacter aporrectodeae subsp. tuberculatae]
MKNDIRMAAAQTVDQCDFNANLVQHGRFIEAAGREGVKLLVFPELSLTGYHRKQASAHSVEMTSPRLDALRRASASADVVAVAGVPLMVDGRLFIASLVIKPDGTMASYCKQHLHPGEDLFFHPGAEGAANLETMGVALAICADTNYPEHAAAASALGVDVYAASCLITNGGYDQDSAQLIAYAAKHAYAVLMANHGGPTGGFEVAGRSAIWDEKGNCVSTALGTGAQLVIAERSSGQWAGRVMRLSLE